MPEQIIGKKSQQIFAEDLAQKVEDYQKTHLDLGTGDGTFALRYARENDETLVVAVDADRDSLAIGSAKAAKKPMRGGAANVLYFCANALEDRPEFADFFNSISINFPWGSLLQAVVCSDDAFLRILNTWLKTDGSLTLYLNDHVLQDEAMRISLGLVDLSIEENRNALLEKYESHGFSLTGLQSFAKGEKVDVHTSWGSKLTKRSGRPTLKMVFAKNG